MQLDAHVTEIGPDRVVVKTDSGTAVRRIDTETVVWAAGVKASPLGQKLSDAVAAAGGTPFAVGRAGHSTVGPDCSLGVRDDLFAIGDMASLNGANGKPLPGVAQVAIQQGSYVGDLIDRRLRGKSAPGPFKYWDKGSMATIGRRRAVADVGFMRFTGLIAWLAWLAVHVVYIANFSNRVLVLFQWFWNYVTRNRSARLITGESSAKAVAAR